MAQGRLVCQSYEYLTSSLATLEPPSLDRADISLTSSTSYYDVFTNTYSGLKEQLFFVANRETQGTPLSPKAPKPASAPFKTESTPRPCAGKENVSRRRRSSTVDIWFEKHEVEDYSQEYYRTGRRFKGSQNNYKGSKDEWRHDSGVDSSTGG